MLTVSALILGALLQTPAQPREARAPQTDETVAVAKGTRLTVENHAGEVIVRTWNRDELRVQARHTTRTKVNVRNLPARVSISSSGTPSSVDYEITAPAWLPVKVNGTFNYVMVDGIQGEVSVETVRGDVWIKGSGPVVARSIEGEVVVEGARGRVTVSSVNEDVRLTGVTGDIVAETTNGSVSLTKISSSNVEVTTINGDVIYDGSVTDRGRYRFATHNGDITAAIPEQSHVTFVVRTYNGDFASVYQVSGPPREEMKSGRRMSYTLGNGSAEMEMESFGGSIRVRRPGAAAAKDKGKDKE